ncbi:MAG: major capsid protein [Microviridae sp.]|nr:MAG: major capsid protein [Microviridae sp.]
MQKTIGGDRLGSGKRMKVDLHGYQRSTHDLGYLWRSTMSAGTLVPFLTEVALPGDTFDIHLDCDIKTHPTIGPLFGSYKVQLDIFQAPIRLYQGQLHNNKLGIGLNMAGVKLPQMSLQVNPDAYVNMEDPDNSQINPSCILSYLGIRGIGMIDTLEPDPVYRQFNAIPLLAYWDIYKNYYSNKQEEIGYVIHAEKVPLINSIDDVTINSDLIPEGPTSSQRVISDQLQQVQINYTTTTPILSQIIFNTNLGQFSADSIALAMSSSPTEITFIWNWYATGTLIVYNWTYIKNGDLPTSAPTPRSFDLNNIDQMRETILSDILIPTAFDLTSQDIEPYSLLLQWEQGQSPYLNTQEGLGLKTYQSDLLNNWLSTEWLDGTGGINEITAIDTSGGSFNIDTLNLSKKVYDMLNRIAISGGTYDDWLDAVYTHDRWTKAESPIYHGGLIRELVFQEVVSNSSTQESSTQPLGTLAGKGIMAQSKKGGTVTIKVDEPSYIMGIISLTPRIDYSQGNKWDTQLKTMDDFHKPALDEIGFQELPINQMAWWTDSLPLAGTTWETKSAGKQPAWINYMTNINQTRGNFAIATNEMFMTLNRRYEFNENQSDPNITDLTTYIDPSKFNFIFANTALDSQNFWAQIAVDITARRKMSAKIMPNV